MKFNVDKCKVMYIGNNNHYTKYTMNCSELFKVSNEKYLVVTISNDLKPSKHCSDLVKKKVNKLFGFIGRTFEYKSEKFILTSPCTSYRILHSVLVTIPKILINWREYKENLLNDL